MSLPRISIGSFTKAGRLHPRYDAESGILVVSAERSTEWCYGVDIDGTVVFDLDHQGRLVNFDVHVRRQLWKRCTLPPWPHERTTGSIVFQQETIRTKSLNLPLELRFDEGKNFLHVALGSREADSRLELSTDCLALLSHMHLVGFLLRRF